MSKFNDLDMWFLKEYENVERMAKAREEMIEKFDNWMEEAIKESVKNQNKEYMVVDMSVKSAIYKDITIYKKQWKEEKAKWPKIAFEVWAWNYECLSSNMYSPAGGVYLNNNSKPIQKNLCVLLKKTYQDRPAFDEFRSYQGYYYHLKFPSIATILSKIKNNEDSIKKMIADEIRELLSVSQTIEDFIKDNKI